MPEKIFALYHYPPADRERAQRLFLDAGLLDVVVSLDRLDGHQKIELSDEETALRLRVAAGQHGLRPPTIRRELHPTDAELRAAPLLYMRVWIHHAPAGHPRADTTYDEGRACSACGDGVRQTSPLILTKREVPRGGPLGVIGDDVLVHESFAEEMLAAGLDGFRFEPVLGPERRALPWRQLVVEHEMAMMTVETRGLARGRGTDERPCTQCGRDGWFDGTDDPFVPAYAAAALDGMPDVAVTAERFGTGVWRNPIHGRRWLANRRLIVRPAMHAFFRARKARGVRFTPVLVT
ncbi:MAG: hypothetical protein M3373_10955 [Gemmatimonadota bacterium]|nr:hypothetical protein [Gemmatimonadota bacterium]